MPDYVVFLRAINLGRSRKFGKDDVRRVTEAAGFTDVATHLNTGNVRVTGRQRSRERVETALEEAYAADRGFEVPCIAFSTAELTTLTELAEEIESSRPGTGRHFVTLLKDEPEAARVADLAAYAAEGEQLVVRGRAAHVLMPENASYTSSALGNARVEKLLGTATTRNLTVIRELSRRWC